MAGTSGNDLIVPDLCTVGYLHKSPASSVARYYFPSICCTNDTPYNTDFDHTH